MEPTFWHRLKQRKIVQWAIGYLAAALALLEGISILEQAYAWSPAFPRVAIAVLGVGFLAVLVIAWFHGERGSQSVHAAEVVLLTFLAFAGVSAAWWAGTTAPGPAADATAQEGTLLTAFDPGTATHSVAVLPFLNMSGNPANDYLADGVTEDVIAELGSLAGLRVISRTSVMRYRNTDKDIPTIGRELGVGTILEGSLRLQDNQVRIVVQLIDVATDAHTWTDTYDGELKDIFGLQTRVARDVAEALNARLLPGVLTDAAETQAVNPDAWRHYVLAKDLSTATDDASRRMARVHLDSAIVLDPEFAKAYEALAEIETPDALDLVPPARPLPAAGQTAGPVESALGAAEKALALNPRLAGAQSAWAIQSAMQRRDMGSAEAAAKKATESNPNSVSARLRYAQILALNSRFEEAMTELGTALKLDPHSSIVESQVGEMYFAMGRTDDALRHLTQAVANDTENMSPRVTRALVLEEQGRVDDALREIQGVAALHPESPLVQGTHGYLLGVAGRHAEATAIAKQLETQVRAGAVPAPIVAQVYAGLGDVDQTIHWLREAGTEARRGGADREVWLMLTPKLRHTFDALREDPRFRAAFDSMRTRVPAGGGDVGRRGFPTDSGRRGARPDGERRGR